MSSEPDAANAAATERVEEQFACRWLIEGELTTETPLRIGDGGSRQIKEKKGNRKIEFDAATIAVDVKGRAYIPGATLKGNLRAAVEVWIDEARADRQMAEAIDKMVEAIFGSRDADRPDALAGKVEFWDAHVAKDFEPTKKPAWWDAERLVGIKSAVAIERRTRTASEQKLFHQEFVPAGVTFKVCLSGQEMRKVNEVASETCGEETIIEVLAALQCFNRKEATLGALTDEGWGRLTWEPQTIKRLDEAGLRSWIAKGKDAPAGYAALEALDSEKQKELKERARELAQERFARHSKSEISVSLVLDCSGQFLVNNPFDAKAKTQTEESETIEADERETDVATAETETQTDAETEATGSTEAIGTQSEEGDNADKAADHMPLCDVNGNPILPERSFKGAMRSQAERILRTIAGAGANDVMAKIACYPDDAKHSCEAVETIDGAKLLCLACQLFGASGWSSPFKCTPFTAAKENGDGEPLTSDRQEFVAIDRFTGGGAEGAKFNADAFYKPQLKGRLCVDLAALQAIGADTWAIGLMALTMRDLVEGDVRIGFGRAKGYGAMRARVGAVSYPAASHVPAALALSDGDLSDQGRSALAAAGANSPFGKALLTAIEELTKKVEARITVARQEAQDAMIDTQTESDEQERSQEDGVS